MVKTIFSSLTSWHNNLIGKWTCNSGLMHFMTQGIPMNLLTFMNYVNTYIAVRTHWGLNISSLIGIFKCAFLFMTMLTVWSFFSCEIFVTWLEGRINKLTSYYHGFTMSVIDKLVVLFLLLNQRKHLVNVGKGLHQHGLISSISIMIIQTHKKLYNIIPLIPLFQHFRLTTFA